MSVEKKTTKICLVGPPHSGKSTLAQQLNLQFNMSGYSSSYIEEYATEYIANNGAPSSVQHQLVIFDEQYKKEQMFNKLKDFIVCDSASWFSYIYGRPYVNTKLNHDITAINQLHKKAIETIDFWDYTFYLPFIDNYKNDGIRYQNEVEARKIGEKIKGFIEVENIPYYDLSQVALDQRIEKILDILNI